jgi:outer membrane lipoprotein
MAKLTQLVPLYGIILALSACATGPKLDTSNVDTSITPQQAVADMEVLRGSGVLWGGVIINANNLQDTTQIELLGYPLSSRTQRPLTEQAPLGRFLVNSPGYLETVDYAQGRQLTLTGELADTRDGKVGESNYTYPLVEVSEMHLWAKEDRAVRTEPRVHFGIGVIFGN